MDCCFFLLRAAIIYLFGDFSKLFYAKSIFLVLCSHWSLCSVVSVVREWPDSDFFECLDPIKKKKKKTFCLFKFFQQTLFRKVLQPEGLKQWPALMLAPHLPVKAEKNTQSYIWRGSFIAHSGTSKPTRKTGHLSHNCLTQGWRMEDGSCYRNTKIYQTLSSSSTPLDAARIWLNSRVPK